MTATTLPTSSMVGAADRALSESRIDADSHFNGLYETRQDLRIEGIAEGEIQCEGTLTVAEGARVKAKVTASTITIAGELQGEVVCRGIFQIMPTGEVEASVSARRLIVQEGGLYNGEFRMIVEDSDTSARLTGATSGQARPAAKRAPSVAHEAADAGVPDSAAAPASGPDVIGSDEWWAKISGQDAATGDAPADEMPS